MTPEMQPQPAQSQPPPLELITLDLDDTLWPVVPTLVAAEAALHDWLVERAPATAARFDAAAHRDLRTALLRERQDLAHDMNWLRTEGLRRALAAAGDPVELAAEAFAIFFAARQRVTLYHEVVPQLARWRRNLKVVAITNGNADIERIGVGHLFDCCISAHVVGFGKPDPRAFRAACDRVGVEPAAALHIGDDLEIDVRAAREAGLRAAWLRRPALDNAAIDRARRESGERDYPDLATIDRELVGAFQISGKPN
jgi:putative hydrolase of the HAD superfamily